jgi:hypothetical protein
LLRQLRPDIPLDDEHQRRLAQFRADTIAFLFGDDSMAHLLELPDTKRLAHADPSAPFEQHPDIKRLPHGDRGDMKQSPPTGDPIKSGLGESIQQFRDLGTTPTETIAVLVGEHSMAHRLELHVTKPLPHVDQWVPFEQLSDIERSPPTGDTHQLSEDGLLGPSSGDSEFFKWYKKGAESGSFEAQYNLGVCYRNGKGVTKDEQLAFQWILRSAQQGYWKAQFDIGYYYANGIGTTKDHKEAVDWLYCSSMNGYSVASRQLAIYIESFTIPSSVCIRQWLSIAASTNTKATDRGLATVIPAADASRICFHISMGNQTTIFDWLPVRSTDFHFMRRLDPAPYSGSTEPVFEALLTTKNDQHQRFAVKLFNFDSSLDNRVIIITQFTRSFLIHRMW